MPGTASATYTFSIGSDDGSQLYIDGALLINNTGMTRDPAGCHVALSVTASTLTARLPICTQASICDSAGLPVAVTTFRSLLSC